MQLKRDSLDNGEVAEKGIDGDGVERRREERQSHGTGPSGQRVDNQDTIPRIE